VATYNTNISKGQLVTAQTALKAVDKAIDKAVDSINKPKPGTLNPTSDTSVSTPIDSEIQSFGAKSSGIANYPNDVVRLDLFNATDTYLGTNYRVGGWNFKQAPEGQSVSLNIEQDVQALGFFAGKYTALYRFHRNILGSGDIDSHKLFIQEISYNGLEVRVRPVTSRTIDNTSFLSQFGEELFKTKKSELLTNLFLFKSQLATPPTAVAVFDYVQDKFTIQQSPYSIIFKLAAPLPSDFVIGDQLWLGQQVSGDQNVEITLTPPLVVSPTSRIAGPNFDILAKEANRTSTNYKDRDDLLTTNIEVKYKIQDKITSGSLVEGINLNQDFDKFENFITYSSAESRLQGFYYKLRQIEAYDARIFELTDAFNGQPGSNATGSVSFLNSVNLTRNRRSAVIGAFDAYERHLYYESSSYKSSSYGEYEASTWPKSNNSKPYINVSVTSSEGVDWFTGAIQSASVFDGNNIKSLTRNTPAHIIEDSSNENYITLLNLVGHYFDDILPYIQQITAQYNQDQSISSGLAKDLLYVIGQNFGFEFEDGDNLQDLWNYALGVDSTGSVNTSYQTTAENTTKEIWKRILNNYPYLLKTKGTERGLRALINCFGIPDTILRIREYGGAEASFDKKSDYVFNRFYYALKVGYTGQTSGLPNASIKAPWQAVSQSGLFPETIELRAQMALKQTKDQTIFEVPSKWKVQAFISNSYNYLGFYLSGSQGWATSSVSSSIYDGGWHSIALRRENNTDIVGDNQVYTLISKRVNYLNVVTTHTASLSINGSTSSSYNDTFLTAGELWIPGSGSFTLAQSHSMNLFSGSVQELRYWGASLDNNILDNHALTPTSFQGNTDGITTGSTSSYATLAYRLSLGSDSKKTLDVYYPSTSSFNSQHPNYTLPLPSASFYNFTSSAYIGITEENSLEWPDLGANRSISTKIRIDSTVLTDNQLFKDTKAEKPLTDNNPPDSPRLGVFLSPSNEINQNIAEQFGGLSIDDFIGDPTYLELDHYPPLEQLQREYSKKYTGPNQPNQYVRILKHYNAALFQIIKQFAPYRANLQTGLLIEPLLIERSKVNIVKHPKVSDLVYTASLDLGPEKMFPPRGEVEDPVNRPEPNYTQQATIGGDETDYLTLTGAAQQITPLNDDAIDGDESDYLTLTGNYFLNPQGAIDASTAPNPYNCENFLQAAGTVDLGVDAGGWNSRYLGSKYVYTSFASSGSNPPTITPITSSRYDEHEAVQPVIITNTYSSQFAPGGEMYDQDIYFGRLFSGQNAYGFKSPSGNIITLLTSSEALATHPLTNNFGLQIYNPIYNGIERNLPYDISLFPVYALNPGSAGSKGFIFGPPTSSTSTIRQLTGSFSIDPFFYEEEDKQTHTYLYRVTIKHYVVNDLSSSPITTTGNPKITLYFGGFNSNLTASINPTLTATTTTITTKADGNKLGVKMEKMVSASAVNNLEGFIIESLKVEPLNYRAQVQDYHLISAQGMVNARYEGCKLTSTDYNVDSLDTVDGGPVITITLVGGTVLANAPAQQLGTFEIQ